MLLDEVAGELISQGVGVAGSTAAWVVAKGYEPATPDRVIVLYETGGFPNEGLSTGTVDRPTFQLRVRGPVNMQTAGAYSTARVKIGAARVALDAVLNKSLSGWKYIHIKAQSEPLFLGYDNTDRPTLAINFQALRSRTS